MTEPAATTALTPSKHDADCGCTRCAGFAPGNGLAVRHGAYARLSLQPRAQTLRAELAELAPLATEADGAAVDLLAITLAQVERAGLVLAVEQAEARGRRELGLPRDEPRLDRLAADCRAWVKTAARLLDQLGMTPTARARLAGDLAAAGRDAGLARLAAEGRAIRQRRELAGV